MFPFSQVVTAEIEQYPTTVPATAVGADNLGGRVAFDDTVANFDMDV